MTKALKVVGALLAIMLIGLAVWGYAPDKDPAALEAQYGGAPSQFLTLPNGQRVHVRDEGSRGAPVLLLIHGSNASLHTWDGWARRLSKDYRVVRYDQPGHGLTGPHVQRDYSTEAFRETAAMVMASLGVERYAVAGNSMGGWVAWNLALAHPERVSALILVDSSGAPEAKPKQIPIGFRLAQSPVVRPMLKIFTPRSIIDASLRQSVGDPDMITDRQVNLYYDLLLYPGNRTATVERGDFPHAPASSEAMAKLTMPTLILWGAKDTLIPPANGDWFDRTIPNSDKIVYPDLGHIPMEEDPDRTAADTAAWLARLTADEGAGA